jgi:hypothetical protein
VLFLDLKFGKNLGFSLSEHCEWGTSFTWILDFQQSGIHVFFATGTPKNKPVSFNLLQRLLC